MAKDPYWSNVVLTYPFDGADAFNAFTDLKGHSTTPVGDAKLSTARYKFGSASLRLDGVEGLIEIAYSADLAMGSSDFTIEGWVWLDSDSSGGRFYGGGEIGGSIWPVLEFSVWPTGVHLLLNYANSNTATTLYGGTVSVSEWHHVAATRWGNTLYLFLDGVQIDTKVWTYSVYNPSGKVCIGGYYNAGSVWASIKGNIDSVRVTKGVARYTANFTPPTEPFPNGPVEVGGTILDSNGSPIARTVRVYDRLTGALVGSGASNASSGTYSIGISTANEVQVVMLDDDLGTLENDQIIRTIPV